MEGSFRSPPTGASTAMLRLPLQEASTTTQGGAGAVLLKHVAMRSGARTEGKGQDDEDASGDSADPHKGGNAEGQRRGGYRFGPSSSQK